MIFVKAAEGADEIAPADPNTLDSVAMNLMKAHSEGTRIGVFGILILAMSGGMMRVHDLLKGCKMMGLITEEDGVFVDLVFVEWHQRLVFGVGGDGELEATTLAADCADDDWTVACGCAPPPFRVATGTRWVSGVFMGLAFLACILEELITFHVFVGQRLLFSGHNRLLLNAMTPVEHRAVIDRQLIRQQPTALALSDAAEQQHQRATVVVGTAQERVRERIGQRLPSRKNTNSLIVPSSFTGE